MTFRQILNFEVMLYNTAYLKYCSALSILEVQNMLLRARLMIYMRVSMK